jgi:hypothetical protein
MAARRRDSKVSHIPEVWPFKSLRWFTVGYVFFSMTLSTIIIVAAYHR